MVVGTRLTDGVTDDRKEGSTLLDGIADGCWVVDGVCDDVGRLEGTDDGTFAMQGRGSIRWRVLPL